MNTRHLAILNLIRRPGSTASTILSLGCAVGLGALLMTVVLMVRAGLAGVDTEVDLLMGPKTSGIEVVLGGFYTTDVQPHLISEGIARTIEEHLPRVKVVPIRQFARAREFPVLATTDAWIHRPPYKTSPEIIEGRWFDDSEEAVVGSSVARSMRLQVGDKFEAESLPFERGETPLWRKTLKVVGIFHSENILANNQILVPLFHAFEFQNAAVQAQRERPFRGAVGVTHMFVFIDPEYPEDEDEVFSMVHDMGAEQIVRVREELSFLEFLTSIGESATAWISAFFVLIASAVAAVLFMERFEALKPELGLLRALGYPRHMVAWTILCEASLIGLTGLAVGVILQGIGLMVILEILNPPWLRLTGDILIPNLILLACSAAACLFTSAFSLIRLYRWDPHDSLRGM